jgi:hypothetical protein
MTAISTVLSIVALPVNLLLYANICYHADVTSDLDWLSVIVALAIVISGISSGLFCSYYCHSHRFNIMANQGKFSSRKKRLLSSCKSESLIPQPCSFFASWQCFRFVAHYLQRYHDQYR